MPGATHRAELHFAVRAFVSNDEVHQIARFIANICLYPFEHGTHFDWWHTLRDCGAIPLFDGFRSALLYPKFVEAGLDQIESSAEEGLNQGKSSEVRISLYR